MQKAFMGAAAIFLGSVIVHPIAGGSTWSRRLNGNEATTNVAAQNKKTVAVPAGTRILIRTVDSIDSSKQKTGYRFTATLETNLQVQNTVIAPRGTTVYGRLAQASSAGKMSGSSELNLELTDTICGNPSLLMLDEPTAGLDVESRRGMWEQIQRFQSRGCAILLTTHYLAEADSLAGRIVVIDKGRVIANGTPDEIKQRGAGRKIRCNTRLPLAEILAVRGVAGARNDGETVEIATTNSDIVVRELVMLDPSLANLEVTGCFISSGGRL